MKTNIKFIKFFSIASGIAFIICYITSVITFNEPWLNNNFLFSIFSGIFASFIVVLITEIKKYFDNKNIAIVSNLVRNFDSEKSHISIMLR